MAYIGFKDLPWSIASDKLLRDKAFNPKYDKYQLPSMVYKSFDNKTSGSKTAVTHARLKTLPTPSKFPVHTVKSKIV